MDMQKPPPLLMESISDNEIRDWLLHRLAPARVELFEQQLLLDDDMAPRLADAETDLLDDLARGRLDADEREAVSRHLLATPADRERLRIAHALAHVGRARPPTAEIRARMRPGRARSLAWSSAIAAGLIMTIGIAFVVRRETFPQRSPQAEPLPSITLAASAPRGGDEDPMVLPAHAERVRLQLEVDAPNAASSAPYDVAIADAERVVFSAHGVAMRTAGPYRFVEVPVPTRALGPGKRRITLTPPAMPQAATHWDITTRQDR